MGNIAYFFNEKGVIITKIFIDIFRMILWAVTSFALWIMDSVYDIVMSIGLLDVFSLDAVWSMWTALCAFLAFFIIVRSTGLFFKIVTNEEKREKYNPIKVICGVFLISVIVFSLPTIVKTGNEIAVESLDNINLFVSTEGIDDLNPSEIIIGEGFDYEEIDINTKEGQDYKYLPHLTDILLALAMAVFSAILFAFCAVMIAKRMFDLAMKLLISPYPISGLIDPEDQSFGTWIKLVIADLMGNFIQILAVYLVLKICSTSVIKALPALTQSFILIGGLVMIIAAPTGIAQLMGSDIGAGNSLYQMMSLRGLTAGLSASGKAAVGSIIGAGATAGAAAIYGAGRAMGGQSMLNPLNPMSVGAASTFSQGGLGRGSGKANIFSGQGSIIPSKAFSEPSTYSQQKAAAFHGFDASNMSKGDASLALEAAGMDKSYFNRSQSPSSPSAGGHGINNLEPDFSGGSAPNAGFESQAGIKPQTQGIARKIGEYGRTHNDYKGASARLVSTAGQHMYQLSAQRLSQQKRSFSGGVRPSNFVRASGAVHTVADAIKPAAIDPATRNTYRKEL